MQIYELSSHRIASVLILPLGGAWSRLIFFVIIRVEKRHKPLRLGDDGVTLFEGSQRECIEDVEWQRVTSGILGVCILRVNIVKMMNHVVAPDRIHKSCFSTRLFPSDGCE